MRHKTNQGQTESHSICWPSSTWGAAHFLLVLFTTVLNKERPTCKSTHISFSLRFKAKRCDLSWVMSESKGTASSLLHPQQCPLHKKKKKRNITLCLFQIKIKPWDDVGKWPSALFVWCIMASLCFLLRNPLKALSDFISGLVKERHNRNTAIVSFRWLNRERKHHRHAGFKNSFQTDSLNFYEI